MIMRRLFVMRRGKMTQSFREEIVETNYGERSSRYEIDEIMMRQILRSTQLSVKSLDRLIER